MFFEVLCLSCNLEQSSHLSQRSGDVYSGLGDGELSIDALTVLEHGLPSDVVSDSLNEDVDEGGLGLSKSVSVGDIPGATSGGGVDSSGTTGLELESATNLLEVLSGGKVGELDHGTSSKTGSAVGRAGEDETEMFVVHEVVSVGGEDILDGSGGVGESDEDGFDVVTLLHGDDSHVILLVNPDEEVHGIVVEDTSGVGPVATTSGGEKEGGIGFLEEVTSRSELLLLGFGHTVGLSSVGSGSTEGEVISLELTLHGEKSLDDESLDFTSLVEGVAGGKSESSNGSSGSASSGENVVASGVNLGGRDVGGVHVGRVAGVGRIAVVSS